jgi:ribosomal-protein-serine acetyltransferase
MVAGGARNKVSFPVSIDVDDAIRLKSVDFADADALFALVDANREHLRAWLPWLDVNQSPADTRQYIERSKQAAADGVGWNLLILQQQRLRGTIGFNWIDHANRSCELGYWLAAEATGSGLVGRSLRTLVEYAFTDMAINRINLAVAPGNLPSRAVAERLGFQAEGVSRQAEWLYDHYVDLVRYALLRQDWQQD